MKTIRKAAAAAVTAGATALIAAFADETVTNAEWGGLAAAVAIAFATVYYVPNAQPDEYVRDEAGEIVGQDGEG